MTMDQNSACMDTYDAMIDIACSPGQEGIAFSRIKLTYSVSEGVCRPTSAEPLFHDIRDDNIKPRYVAGTDFWPDKEATDVVVRGSAFAGGGTSRRSTEVSVQVGGTSKRVAVFGPRAVTWRSDGRPHIEEPRPFEEIPMTWDNAYGGMDWRVTPEDPHEMETQTMLSVDHPGIYPRNPFGKGYLVEPGVVPEMLMPHLEDPDDLLSAERLIVGDARSWYRQPIPWCLDWVHLGLFPRPVLFAPENEPWYPGPEDHTLPEVRRGFLFAGYRGSMERRTLEEGPHPSFYQGASHGLVIPDLGGGAPVVVRGMHPERSEVAFLLPAPPEVEITVEGDRQRVLPRLHSVVCYPAEEKLTMTFAARRPLTRPFVPGVHGKIPVSLSVNGDTPLEYATPVPVRERVALAQEQAARASRKGRRRRRRRSRQQER